MFYLVLALLLVIGVAWFALQNATPVELAFFGWRAQSSLALVAIGGVIVGAALAGLSALVRQIGLGLRLGDARARAERTRTELEQARLAAAAVRRELEALRLRDAKLVARVAELEGRAAPASSGTQVTDGDKRRG